VRPNTCCRPSNVSSNFAGFWSTATKRTRKCAPAHVAIRLKCFVGSRTGIRGLSVCLSIRPSIYLSVRPGCSATSQRPPDCAWLSSRAAERLPAPRRRHVDAAVGIWTDLRAARKEALRRGELSAIVAGAFLHADHRGRLWMGGLRPSEVLDMALEKVTCSDIIKGYLLIFLKRKSKNMKVTCPPPRSPPGGGGGGGGPKNPPPPKPKGPPPPPPPHLIIKIYFAFYFLAACRISVTYR
jgi:hypothetical protein